MWFSSITEPTKWYKLVRWLHFQINQKTGPLDSFIRNLPKRKWKKKNPMVRTRSKNRLSASYDRYFQRVKTSEPERFSTCSRRRMNSNFTTTYWNKMTNSTANVFVQLNGWFLIVTTWLKHMVICGFDDEKRKLLASFNTYAYMTS